LHIYFFLFGVILDYFRRNEYFCATLIIHFHVQPYISAFRNRKDGRSKECKQKIFAAQTPQRKRGFFFTHLTIVGKAFSAPPKFAIFARRCSALLDMGFCTKQNYFGASVIFYIVKQSTGHTFPTSLPTAR